MRGKPDWISAEVRRRKQEAGCFYLVLASLNAWLFSPSHRVSAAIVSNRVNC